MINGLGGLLKLVAVTWLKWFVCWPRQIDSLSKMFATIDSSLRSAKWQGCMYVGVQNEVRRNVLFLNKNICVHDY